MFNPQNQTNITKTTKQCL